MEADFEELDDANDSQMKLAFYLLNLNSLYKTYSCPQQWADPHQFENSFCTGRLIMILEPRHFERDTKDASP